MKHFLLSLSIGCTLAAGASAGVINYNTNNSTLSCNGVAGCVQGTSQQVTVGGLTLTYTSGSGSGVSTPSIINLGNLLATGTGTNVNLTGLLLTIQVLSTPPGTSGNLPGGGTISGTMSTATSGSIINWTPNNTNSTFGTLPGVTISGGGQSFLYQVLNPTLGIPSPIDANSTSIQGAVSDTSAPEPATFVLLGAGLGLVGFLRRRSA